MFRLPLFLLLVLVLVGGCHSSSVPSEEFISCQDGLAAGFPCNNVDLYAALTLEELLAEKVGDIEPRANDIWGWRDPFTGQEYALVGLSDGVAMVDVTLPWAPVVVGKLAEIADAPEADYPPPWAGELLHNDGRGSRAASVWRDLKVFQNFMYVVTEQNHGMQVFDLTRLRDIDNPPVIFREDFHYTKFDNAHNLAINEETGFAYAVGITSGETCAERGGLHMIRLHENPRQPEFAGCYFEEGAGGITRNGYIHDTQCVIYRGPDRAFQGRELCFSSSETTFTITDVQDKENAFTIFNGTYEGNAYAHQGWLTEDHRFFFMNDEQDEINQGTNTRTYVWDVQNLHNAHLIGFHEHPTRSIDHNLYIRDDIMYQANYTAGLRLLDVSSPLPHQVSEIGFFDTTPGQEEPIFEGLWSVYPWLSGRTVIVSDIRNGLFILRVDR